METTRDHRLLRNNNDFNCRRQYVIALELLWKVLTAVSPYYVLFYKIFSFGALVLVEFTSLHALLCVTRALQLAVSSEALLFAASSATFQTTSTTSTILITGISFTYHCFAVSSWTGKFTFCRGWTCHVAFSTCKKKYCKNRETLHKTLEDTLKRRSENIFQILETTRKLIDRQNNQQKVENRLSHWKMFSHRVHRVSLMLFSQ